MTYGWRPLPMPGAWRRRLELHEDVRGSFAELWRASWLEGLPGTSGTMRQANLSRSQAGVLRGLHMHLRQADLWVVVDGHPLIALVDVRPMLEGNGEPVAATIDAAPGEIVYLPEGVAHGFYARDPLTLVYLVTNEFDASDELGFAWDDPAGGIAWPTREPILSDRDRSNPSLRELVESLRQQTPER